MSKQKFKKSWWSYLRNKIKVISSALVCDVDKVRINKVNGKIYLYFTKSSNKKWHIKYNPKTRVITIKTKSFSKTFNLNEDIFNKYFDLDYPTVLRLYKIEEKILKLAQ